MARKRANGEGSVFRRKDGLWSAELTQPNGKRKTFYGKTRTKVLEKRKDFITDLARGRIAMSPDRKSLAQWLDHWLDNIQREDVAESTLGQQQWRVNKHIKPRIGSVSLARIEVDHIERLHADMKRAKVGLRTRQLVHEDLRNALRVATERGKIGRNPCEFVKAPRRKRSEVRAFTADERAALLHGVDGDRYEAMYRLALNSGMRWGELAGLQWADVDLRTATVRVRRAQREIYSPGAPKGHKHRIELAETKTKASRRSIRIGQNVVAALKAHRNALGAVPMPTARVFTAPDGAPLRRSNFIRREWRPLLKVCKLPIVGFNTLRHTMATDGLRMGLHPKVVQTRLGHAQIGTTLDVYTDALPELDAEAADLLDAEPRTRAAESIATAAES